MRKGCINEVKRLQKIAGLLKESELDLLYNPLQPRKRKAKDKLIDVMVEDCIENYDGDFEAWEQSLYDVMPYQITVAFRDLETAIGEKEFDDIMEYEVYPEVKKRIKNYINEEDGLDLSNNPFYIKDKINISDINFDNQDNINQIFSIPATDEDIEDFEQGKVEVVWENEEYGGSFGVFELPSGEFMFAFADAEFYVKAPLNVKIINNIEEDLDLSDNPLSWKNIEGEFKVGDEVVVSYNTSYGEEEVEFFTIRSVAKDYDHAKRKDPDIADDWLLLLSLLRDGGKSIKNQPWYEVDNLRGTKKWFPEDQLQPNEYN
jgi:hypothetical protein